MFGGGAAKAVGSNQGSTVGLVEPAVADAVRPRGRAVVDAGVRKTVNGRPVDSVTMPLNCQSCRGSLEQAGVREPVVPPNGSAQTQLRTKRCLTSKPEGPLLWVEERDALRPAHGAAARGGRAGVVERLAERVARQVLQAAREALVQLDLQAVVARAVDGVEVDDL